MAVFLVLVLSLLMNALCLGIAFQHHSWLAAVAALFLLKICWRYREVTTVVPYGLAVIIAVGMVGVTTGTLASFLHLLGVL